MIACGNRGMSELFRREAISHATQRLAGAVVLATPLSVRVLGLFFGSIVVAALIAVSTATYARKATVTGWLIPDQGLIRATSASAGFVQAVFVKEGQQVERGATLAELRTGADTVGGNVSEMYLGQLRAEAEATRARAQTQLERLSAESEQNSVRLTKSRLELEQLGRQAQLQTQRLQLARQELVRGQDLATRGISRAQRSISVKPRRSAPSRISPRCGVKSASSSATYRTSRRASPRSRSRRKRSRRRASRRSPISSSAASMPGRAGRKRCCRQSPGEWRHCRCPSVRPLPPAPRSRW